MRSALICRPMWPFHVLSPFSSYPRPNPTPVSAPTPIPTPMAQWAIGLRRGGLPWGSSMALGNGPGL